MQAVIADGDGGLAIVERRVPQPGPGEVLIRVAAAGVNRPDVLQKRGAYPPPPGAPDVLGLEVAGEVIGAGEGTEQLRNQNVCALVALAKQDLDPMSIEELMERVEALKVEIVRVESHIKKVQDHRSAAEELFKKS